MSPKENGLSLFASREVDETVNALFSALTNDLGRPFVAGRRNVRSVVHRWCPLSQSTEDMDVDAFQQNYVASHFFDRYLYTAEVESAADLEAQALVTFKENLARGLKLNSGKLRFLPYGRLNTVLKSASMEIQRILGPLEVEEWFPLCCHGPNATLNVQRTDAYADKKAQALDGTLPCIRLHQEYLRWNNHLSDYLEPMVRRETVAYEPVPGNRLSFVPKKFDRLRTMMVEPTLNMFFQQGLGNLIRMRLKQFGQIDIETQPIVHRSLVRLITANDLPMATIDWSQASDRIWLTLCQRLLPSDWFAALLDTRSPVAVYKGEELPLSMAASMGNGWCFPLQTLIFLTLIRAIAREAGKPQFVTVFGDDCICDSSLKDDLGWLAHQLGWKMNLSKSFFDGGFRESCGEDSYRGRSCRPFMIQRPDKTCKTANDYAAWAYNAYNLSSALIGEASRCEHIGEWLTDFLSQAYTREKRAFPGIHLVPARFSGQSGVQVNNLDKLPPFPAHLLNRPMEGYFYPYHGFYFSFLSSKSGKRQVDEHAYYLLALEGKGVPSDFKKREHAFEESVEGPCLVSEGHVPSKERKLRNKTGYVYNWSYFTD